MRGRPWHRPPQADKLSGAPAPLAIDWQKWNLLNKSRVAKYGPDAFIPADEWEAMVREGLQPKPVLRRMTRSEVAVLKNTFARMGKELSAADILSLMGVDVTGLKADFEAIESDYRVEIQRGKDDIERMQKLGYPTPAGALERAIALADETRDQAIASARDLLNSAAQTLRESHKALIYQAKLNSVVAVSGDKAAQMGALMSRCGDVMAIRRLHAQAIANGDEAGAYFIEQNGAQALAAIPGRMNAHPEAEAYEFQMLAGGQRERRAGEPFQKIVADEKELAEALHEVNWHPTSIERRDSAQAILPAGLDPKYMPGDLPANVSLPDADPIFD